MAWKLLADGQPVQKGGSGVGIFSILGTRGFGVMANSTTKVSSSGRYAARAAAWPASMSTDSPLHAYIESAMEGIEDYARREPWAFASWVFGVGFVLGWKLKPW
jgi:hypothetical protein